MCVFRTGGKCCNVCGMEGIQGAAVVEKIGLIRKHYTELYCTYTPPICVCIYIYILYILYSIHSFAAAKFWASFPTLSILTHFPWHLREHLPQWELPNYGMGGPRRKEIYIRWLSQHLLFTLSSKVGDVGEILTDHIFIQIAWNLIQPWLLSLSLSQWWLLEIASVTVSVTVGVTVV